ncbi:MAG TPA: hypothetical protein VF478_01005 [Anaerolineae bacterium]
MMEESSSARPLVGRWLALELRPTRPLTWLGPAWAVLCGAVASGGLLPRGQTAFLLIFSLLLGDVLLGAWRALWLQPDWRDAVRRAVINAPTWYVESDDAYGWRVVRLIRRIGGRVRFLRKVILPAVDSEIVGMAMVGALALSVAVVLGQTVVALTLAALFFALVEGQVSGERGAYLRALFEIALPWLIAESAFGYFSWLSLFYVLIFTLVYRSLVGLAETRRTYWLVWSNLAQLLAALALFVGSAPAVAGLAALGLLAQVLWQSRFRVNRDGRAYVQRVQSYVLVVMLAAAFAIALI